MFKIRRATSEDAQAIATLNVPVQRLHHKARPDIFKPANDSVAMVDFYTGLLENPDNFVYIGEADDKPVGYVSAQVHRRPEHPFSYAQDFVYVDQISVNPDQRGKGYGRQLTDAVIDLAKREGVARVTLSVWLFNEDAVHFYERLGFKGIIQSMEYILDGGSP